MNEDVNQQKTNEPITEQEMQEAAQIDITQEEILEAMETMEEAEIVPEVVSDDKTKKIEELNDRLLRSLAEFDNFRKRTAKEKTAMYDFGAQDTIMKLLPVIDNLDRALQSSENREDKLYQGVSMIQKQLSEILVSIGVTEIKALGETFDHNKHEAIMHVEDENYAAGEIILDIQKGYMYKDKVLRHSMVKVAN